MVFADFGQKIIDVSSDISAGSLNTGNNLEGSNKWLAFNVNESQYLRDNIKPSVYLDGRETASHRVTNIVMSTELKPQGQ